MEYGQIMKKAWTIAWRYRFLWILGIFAGVTGPSGGGGGFNGNSFNSGGSGGSGSAANSPFPNLQTSSIETVFRQWLPAIFALALIWFLIALFFAVLSIAARGGLIWAVNEIEESRTPRLGDAWKQGFTHFWSLFGLGILLALPMLLALIVLFIVIVLPIVGAIAYGGKGAIAAAVPVCGGLLIAIPLLIVLSFVLGVMNVVGQRRIVLDGIGVIQSAKDAWRTLRTRFKDTGLMWLINWGLNIAAGIALAIPIIIVTVVLAVPAIFAGIGGSWGLLVGLGGFYLIIVLAIGLFFTGVWGTFTSSLWTILYRRMTGREQVVPTPPRTPHPYPGGPSVAPAYPQAPAPPSPSSGFGAPPAQGWAPPPSEPSGWSPESPAPQRGLADDPYRDSKEFDQPHDPYGGSAEHHQPLDPYTPWDASGQHPDQPAHE